jgi:hypothetical protein
MEVVSSKEGRDLWCALIILYITRDDVCDQICELIDVANGVHSFQSHYEKRIQRMLL